jgi:hypothetical protein
MFCPYCGKKIREEAVFCPQCGKRLNEEDIAVKKPKEFSFPESSASLSGRWTAETDLGILDSFSLPIASLVLERIADGRYQFLVLTPPQPIQGCRFIQFCSDDQGKLHAEIALVKGNGTVIQAMNHVGIREGVLMIDTFLNGQRPSFPK